MRTRSSPTVSIVVPTYNRAYCLGSTLESALRQTHQAIELIVVDDGSTDETPALLERLQREDSRIRCFAQPNQGVVAARNLALTHATGDYIAFLDSDDRWFPWKVELQLACFRRFPELGMVWSDMTAIDASGAVVNPAYLRTMYTSYRRADTDALFPEVAPLPRLAPPHGDLYPDARLRVGVIYSQMLYGSLVHTSTVMLTRQRFEQVGLFDTAMGRSGEDYDFHLRTCREGPVGLIDVPTIAYQTGLGDRLTRPEFAVSVAEGYLKTVTKAIARDRPRLQLSDAEITSIVAGAHIWLGEELVEANRHQEARTQFALAFRTRPAIRPLLRWARARLPATLTVPLRRVYRAARTSPVQHA